MKVKTALGGMVLSLLVLVANAAEASPVSLTCRAPDGNGNIPATGFSIQVILDEGASTVTEGSSDAVHAQFTESNVSWSLGSNSRDLSRTTGVLRIDDGESCYNARDGKHCSAAIRTFKCDVATKKF